MLIASFLSYQHYRICVTYVQPYVPTQTEKKLPAFWWFYTTWDEEFFHRPILCLAAQFLRWNYQDIP